MKLVVGYGAPRCGDDGAGTYAAEWVAEAKQEIVETRIFKSPPLEPISERQEYGRVIFVESGLQVPEVRTAPVERLPAGLSAAFSHSLAPDRTTHLSEALRGKRADAFVCAIRRMGFTRGAAMTGTVRQRADRVVREILRMPA